MQEVFSKTTDPTLPLEQQEFFELALVDLGTPFQPRFIDSMGVVARHRFIVREAHAAWSEIDRDIMFDDFQHDECSTIQEAERKYQARRAAIVSKGIVYSDMDL